MAFAQRKLSCFVKHSSCCVSCLSRAVNLLNRQLHCLKTLSYLKSNGHRILLKPKLFDTSTGLKCSSTQTDTIHSSSRPKKDGLIHRKESLSPRVNYSKIQMLSPSIHKQIFRNCPRSGNCPTREQIERPLESDLLQPDPDVSVRIKQHLVHPDLWEKESSLLDDIDFPLPVLHGDNIDEHFKEVAIHQSKHYFGFAESMSSILHPIPKMPHQWLFKSGWTKYSPGESPIAVDVPEEDALVFDVEVCMNAGDVPVLATALSKSAW